MRPVSRDDNLCCVEFSEEEIMILNNALNEVCNGVHIEDWEFQTRLGVERTTARNLLTQVNGLFGGRP